MTYQAKKFISWSHSFGKMIKENDQLNSWINQRCKTTSRESRTARTAWTPSSNHRFSTVVHTTLETDERNSTDTCSRTHEITRSNSLLTQRLTGSRTGSVPGNQNSKKSSSETKQG